MNKYYSLVKPKQGTIDFNAMQFTNNNIAENRVWEINSSLYLLASDANESYLVRPGGLTNNAIFDYYKFSFQEIKNIFKHYVRKNEVFMVKFAVGGFDSSSEHEYEEFNDLIQNLRHPNLIEEGINKTIELFDYLLDELETFHQFTFILNHKNFQLSLYRNSIILTPLHCILYSKDGISEEEQHEIIINFYKEIIKVLELTDSDEVVLSEQTLLPLPLYPHPLRHANKVIQKALDRAADDLKLELNLLDYEYELIKEYVNKNFKSYETSQLNEEQLARFHKN